MFVLRAHTVAPVGRPPLPDGALAVAAGRIAAVGRWSDLRRDAPVGAVVRDLGRCLLVPGLVNAHTHVELSSMRAAELPEGDYAAWVGALVAHREAEETEARHSAARHALAALRRRGTVALGDVANESWSAPLIAAAGLRGVVFHEVYGFRSADARELLEAAERRVRSMRETLATVGPPGGAPRVVASPHAPHTTSAALLRGLAAHARAENAPLSVHVAESEAECRLLADGGGPLPELFRRRGVWDDGFRPPGVSPVAYLDGLGALGPRTLAVHAIHLDGNDRAILRDRGCTVVTCPRSNARLGVGTAPLAALIRDGVPLALGTDSTASAPDLDLLAEMAALRRTHPGLDPARILRMATLDGARALGIDGELGSLEAGKRAAWLAVPVTGTSTSTGGAAPLDALCDEPAEVQVSDGTPCTEPT